MWSIKKFKFDFKKHILLNIPYIAIFYAMNKLSAATRVAEGSDVSAKFFSLFDDFSVVFANPLPSFHVIDLLVGGAVAFVFWFVMREKRKNAKKFRQGKEYGSARWGTAKDIEPYMDENPDKNIILSSAFLPRSSAMSRMLRRVRGCFSLAMLFFRSLTTSRRIPNFTE